MNELTRMELEELQRLSAEELEGFNIDSLEKLTWTFRKVNALNEKIKDIENVAKAERERIDNWERKELEPHQGSLSYFESKIFQYHASVLANDPKSKSINTPYGKVKSLTKKAQPEKDNEAILVDYLNMYNPDFVKEKVEVSVDWAEFKKKLSVVETPDGLSVVDDRGMIVEGVKVKPETTTFKLEL